MTRIDTPRLLLRDFRATDRAAFLAYQADPRYRRLYDLPDGDAAHADALFDTFATWRAESPRRNLQLGVFDRRDGRLLGCGGLRGSPDGARQAELGLELAPDQWGRHAVALEAAQALIDHGFDRLDLERITGSTASGNRRVEKLARWFGAEIVATGPGASWMTDRGWVEVTWQLTRDAWRRPDRRRRRA